MIANYTKWTTQLQPSKCNKPKANQLYLTPSLLSHVSFWSFAFLEFIDIVLIKALVFRSMLNLNTDWSMSELTETLKTHALNMHNVMGTLISEFQLYNQCMQAIMQTLSDTTPKLLHNSPNGHHGLNTNPTRQAWEDTSHNSKQP